MSSVYMYHAVGNNEQIEGADPHYAVTEENFAKQIALIAKSIPLAEQVTQKRHIYEHCVTFDDGHLSNYTVAYPLLKALKMHAEFYINTAYVGNENYMSWAQLKEMSDNGMSIQSHSHNHFYISTLSDEDVEFELLTSKQLIEEQLNKPVIVFAPPGGRINQRVVKIAERLGYKCIATSTPGVIGNSTDFTVPRFAVLASTTSRTIEDWFKATSIATLKERIRFHSFALLKSILGNGNYEKLRNFVLTGNAAK